MIAIYQNIVITNYCDNNNHIIDSQSAWQVLKEREDFIQLVHGKQLSCEENKKCINSV